MAYGDGSLGLVAGIAAAHDVPFVCIPAGTRNHFGRDMGLIAPILKAWPVYGSRSARRLCPCRRTRICRQHQSGFIRLRRAKPEYRDSNSARLRA